MFASVASAGAIPGAVFAEVECRTQQELCQQHGAGVGGWPTVKAFTRSEPNGIPFPRSMEGPVCDELISPGVLERFVTTVSAATHEEL